MSNSTSILTQPADSDTNESSSDERLHPMPRAGYFTLVRSRYSFQRGNTVSTTSVNFTGSRLISTEYTGEDMREIITLRSNQIAVFHDQMHVFSDPDSAEMLGHILDQGSISFDDLYSRINSPNDIRTLILVAKARLLRETMNGIVADPAALQIANRILENAGLIRD